MSSLHRPAASPPPATAAPARRPARRANTTTLAALALAIGLLVTNARAITLSEALAQADTRLGVVNALLELDDSRRALERSRADPLALRLERTQAEQRALLAESRLEQSRYQAYVEIAQGYTQLLEAQHQLEIAEAAERLSAQALEIARIRFQRGSATALDVRDAENGLEDAATNLEAATQGVALARLNLQGLTGLEVERAEPVAVDLDTLEPPSPEDIAAALARHPTLLQATQGLELARLGRELLDPAYAAPTQIEAAELQIEQAEAGARESLRGMELQAQSLRNTAVSARRSLGVARETFATAQAREDIERQRLEAGLIADITFRQIQLSTLQGALTLLRAEHAYLRALLDLQAGTLTPILGLRGD